MDESLDVSLEGSFSTRGDGDGDSLEVTLYVALEVGESVAELDTLAVNDWLKDPVTELPLVAE